MKLDRYKHVEETDSHFVLEDEGGRLNIPKAHLHHGTVEKIRKHFAGGGVVEDSELPIEPLVLPSRVVIPGEGPKDVTPSAPAAPPTYEGMGTASPWFSGDDNAAFKAIGAQPPAPMPTGKPVLSPDTQALAAPPSSDVGPPAGPVALPSRQPPPAASPAPAPQRTGPDMLARGFENAIEGVRGEAAARQQGMQQEAGIADASAKQMQDFAKQTQELLQRRMDEADKMANGIRNSQINPDRFWQTRTTGDKVTAAIGLLLGGIGAGLTRGPNYAMGIIDKAIDRDIEAQKINLGKQQNLLSHYMAQTRDLSTAQQLAKADYLTATAARMQAAQARMGAAVANPEAQKAIGAMEMEAVKIRQQATMGEAQIRQSEMGLRYQQAQMDLMGNIMKQAGGASGVTIPPGAEMLLPKEMQETLVRMPDGRADFARSPKDAEEIRRTQETTTVLRQKLARYAQLQRAHPMGISETLSPGDYSAAKSLHESILTDLNGLAGLNRFTHEEAQVFSKRIPDLTSIQRGYGAEAQLGELGQEIDDKIRATNKNFLRFSK